VRPGVARSEARAAPGGPEAAQAPSALDPGPDAAWGSCGLIPGSTSTKGGRQHKGKPTPGLRGPVGPCPPHRSPPAPPRPAPRPPPSARPPSAPHGPRLPVARRPLLRPAAAPSPSQPALPSSPSRPPAEARERGGPPGGLIRTSESEQRSSRGEARRARRGDPSPEPRPAACTCLSIPGRSVTAPGTYRYCALVSVIYRPAPPSRRQCLPRPGRAPDAGGTREDRADTVINRKPAAGSRCPRAGPARVPDRISGARDGRAARAARSRDGNAEAAREVAVAVRSASSSGSLREELELASE
jgi:hypothetical protein